MLNHTDCLTKIPELTDDPSSPNIGDVWILRESSGATTGSPMGLLLSLTYASGAGTTTYTLKIETASGTISTEFEGLWEEALNGR